MSQRTKIILLLLILVIVLAAAVAVWRFKGKPTIQPVVINEPEIMEEIAEQTAGEENSALPPEAAVPDEDGQQEIRLVQQASDFAERFGSYSAAGNFANIAELNPFMTESMQKRAEEYAAKLRQETSNDFGVTTRVISRQTIEYNPEKEIKILLSAQRQESVFGKENVYYQDMDVEIVKENGEWKVNKAEWR